MLRWHPIRYVCLSVVSFSHTNQVSHGVIPPVDELSSSSLLGQYPHNSAPAMNTPQADTISALEFSLKKSKIIDPLHLLLLVTAVLHVAVAAAIQARWNLAV